MQISRRSSLLGLGLALLLAQPSGATAGEPVAETVLARVKIESGDAKLAHPGHLIELDVENTLVLTNGSKHEVTLLVKKKGKEFEVRVSYEKNGRAVLSGTTKVAKKKWGTVKKGATKVSVQVDPDSKRPDDIDKPEDDDPLGGL